MLTIIYYMAICTAFSVPSSLSIFLFLLSTYSVHLPCFSLTLSMLILSIFFPATHSPSSNIICRILQKAETKLKRNPDMIHHPNSWSSGFLSLITGIMLCAVISILNCNILLCIYRDHDMVSNNCYTLS